MSSNSLEKKISFTYRAYGTKISYNLISWPSNEIEKKSKMKRRTQLDWNARLGQQRQAEQRGAWWLVRRMRHVKDSFFFVSHWDGEIKKRERERKAKQTDNKKFNFYKLWNASENAGERALTGSTLAALTASRERGQKREETTRAHQTRNASQRQEEYIFKKKERLQPNPKRLPSS